MQKWALISTFVSGMLVASLLQNTSWWPAAEAAPADVFGSANVAVDTYRNRKGTYVVWSNGRVTDVAHPDDDLGHPFQDPPSEAKIAPPKTVTGSSLGSPHVAVKAISRGDATYVLFSDGTMKLPGNADAAAPASVPGRVVLWNSNPGQSPTEGWTVTENEFTLSYSAGIFTIALNEPMPGANRRATAVFTIESTSAGVISSLGLQGAFSSDGRIITFDPRTISPLYVPTANNPVGFQFVASGE
jgi:hypothetical protein